MQICDEEDDALDSGGNKGLSTQSLMSMSSMRVACKVSAGTGAAAAMLGSDSDTARSTFAVPANTNISRNAPERKK